MVHKWKWSISKFLHQIVGGFERKFHPLSVGRVERFLRKGNLESAFRLASRLLQGGDTRAWERFATHERALLLVAFSHGARAWEIDRALALFHLFCGISEDKQSCSLTVLQFLRDQRGALPGGLYHDLLGGYILLLVKAGDFSPALALIERVCNILEGDYISHVRLRKKLTTLSCLLPDRSDDHVLSLLALLLLSGEDQNAWRLLEARLDLKKPGILCRSRIGRLSESEPVQWWHRHPLRTGLILCLRDYTMLQRPADKAALIIPVFHLMVSRGYACVALISFEETLGLLATDLKHIEIVACHLSVFFGHLREDLTLEFYMSVAKIYFLCERYQEGSVLLLAGSNLKNIYSTGHWRNWLLKHDGSGMGALARNYIEMILLGADQIGWINLLEVLRHDYS
jgi:hypothetical protein